jgi:Luciferase
MKNLENLERTVLSWADVSIHPHRFGGREFRYGAAELGHIHTGGILDIPFPRLIHDALLAAGLAEQHRWVPDSGWVTFRIRNEQDLQHGLWLMRLSYLRYSLKRTTEPEAVLESESVRLGLSAEFKSLLAQFIPAKSRLVEAKAS